MANTSAPALVLGFGSIGRRYTRLLGNLLGSAHVFDPGLDAAVSKEPTYQHARFLRSLDEIEVPPSMVFVCTPNADHVRSAMAGLKWKVPLFIEKPLSHATEGLDELSAEAARLGIVTMVSCNMRFHPGIQKVREVLTSGALGRIAHFRFEFGYHLPIWRPWQDYRQSYSARADLGGGVLLDAIHEIDLANWLLDGIAVHSIQTANLGFLGIETEEVADLLVRANGGALGTLHLDYLQRSYDRSCRLIGADGTLWWDYTTGEVRLYEAARGATTTWRCSDGYVPDHMYEKMLRYFLEHAQSGEPCMNAIPEAAALLRRVLTARASR